MTKTAALDELIRKQVLPRFGLAEDSLVSLLEGGLINQTFLVSTGLVSKFVLQRVNPVFPASIHDNIHAVTTALVRAGLVTPVLVPTKDGRQYLELPADTAADQPSLWRVMTHVEGVSFDVPGGPTQARAAGALVARFHAALAGLSHPFTGLRGGVHDTPRHLDHLRQTTASQQGHRLFRQVAPLAVLILDGARGLPALPSLPPRICHGDLKFNNLLFASSNGAERDHALCLIDLDTVGPMHLAYELGDAWRSWCNRSGEDQEQADLDLDLFAASLDGYREGLGRALLPDEAQALLLGPDWISLELAARFAADALAETYFGWDAARFSTRGAHNLVRARGQWSLHVALVASRPHRARLLGIS